MTQKSLRDPDALAQEVLDRAWAELSDARATANTDPGNDFTVHVVGNKFTVKKRGEAFEAFAGRVKAGGAAEQWCRQYNMQATSRYSSSWYGVDAAATCAREWCARMQYFYNIFQESGNPGYRFTSSDVAECPTSVAYRDLVGRVTGAQSRRVFAIMELAPRVG